jgi:tight adherence protein B
VGFIAFIVIALSVIGAVILFAPVVSGFFNTTSRNRQLWIRMGQESSVGKGRILNRGFPPFRIFARVLLSWDICLPIFRQIRRILHQRGYCCGLQPLAEFVLLTFLFCFFTLWFLLDSFISALLLIVLFVSVIGCGYARQETQLFARLLEQLPDAMHGLGICALSGLTLAQAFERTAEGLRPPLSDEFAQVAFDLQAGKDTDAALEALSRRVPLSEMAYLVVALSVQKRTGGSLKTLLDRSAQATAAASDLRRTLRVQTAQARLSAWIVTLMPLAILAIISCASPGYLSAFFGSSLGCLLFFSALIMEAVGVCLIRHILGLKIT